jgi:hypothetical protein
MKFARAVVLSAVASCSGAALSAQAPPSPERSVHVTLIPRAGLVIPDAYMYEQYVNFSGDGPVEWTNGSLGRALVVGIGCEVGSADRRLMLRGEILRSLDGWLSAAHSVVVPRQMFEPPRVETTWLDARVALTLVSVQLVLPTRLTVWSSEPYVLAGVAGKRYDVGDPTTVNDVEAILPASGTTWGVDVGAGITVPLFGASLDLQGRDAVNRYWGKTEHDFVVSTGVAVRIR